jgi:hypothetical protein
MDFLDLSRGGTKVKLTTFYFKYVWYDMSHIASSNGRDAVNCSPLYYYAKHLLTQCSVDL